MPFKLSLEKRVEDVPKWMPAATSIGAVVLAFIISGIILKLIGGQPILVGRYFYEATFGSWAAFSDTLVKATPLILTGLAVTIAFTMKLWNIGAEGQLFFGATLATAFIIYGPVLPKPLELTVLVILGAVGGALWAAIPALLSVDPLSAIIILSR